MHSPLKQNFYRMKLWDLPKPHPFTKTGHSGELLTSALLSFKNSKGAREMSYKKGPRVTESIWKWVSKMWPSSSSVSALLKSRSILGK